MARLEGGGFSQQVVRRNNESGKTFPALGRGRSSGSSHHIREGHREGGRPHRVATIMSVYDSRSKYHLEELHYEIEGHC